eukprot:367758-Hanusia_phi.AAC.3
MAIKKEPAALALAWIQIMAVHGFMQVQQPSQLQSVLPGCCSKLSGPASSSSSMLTSSFCNRKSMDCHGFYSQTNTRETRSPERERTQSLRMCDRDLSSHNEYSLRSVAEHSNPYQLSDDTFDVIRAIPQNSLPENIPLRNIFRKPVNHFKQSHHPEHSLQRRIKIFASDVEREIAFWTRGLGMTVFTEESSILLSYDDIAAYYTAPGGPVQDDTSNVLELVEGNQFDGANDPALKQKLYIQLPFRPHLLDDIKKTGGSIERGGGMPFQLFAGAPEAGKKISISSPAGQEVYLKLSSFALAASPVLLCNPNY